MLLVLFGEHIFVFYHSLFTHYFISIIYNILILRNNLNIWQRSNKQMYDQERDKGAKARLQDIMNKYNIKQVEVARETGKSISPPFN